MEQHDRDGAPGRPSASAAQVPVESSAFDEIVRESGIGSDDRESLQGGLVHDLLRAEFELKGSIERIATEKDDTYRLRTTGGDFLVKISPADEDPEIVDLQTEAVLHLEAVAPELPVQRLVRAVDGRHSVLVPGASGPFPRVMRVLQFVPGTLLAEIEPTPPQLEQVGAMLARVTTALASFRHPRATRRLLWDLQNFAEMRVMCDYVEEPSRRSAADEVFRRFESHVLPALPRLPRQVVHGDFSPHNVLIDPRREQVVSGVIDFGDVVESAVAFDVSVPMANQLGVDHSDPWSRPTHVLRGYARVAPLNDLEVSVLADSALARLLLRALVAGWQSERSPDRHRYLLTHASQDWTNLLSGLDVPRDQVLARLHESSAPVRHHHHEETQA